MRQTRAKRAGVAGLAVAGLVLGSGGQALAAGEWTKEDLPQENHISGLTSVMSGDGMTWAFGYNLHNPQPSAHTTAFQRTDQGWKQREVPDTGTIPGDSEVLSADDAWVAAGKPLHWDGQKWTEVPLGETPPEYDNTQLEGMAAFGADDIWMAGKQGKGDAPETQGAVQHWDGQEFSDVTVPKQPEKVVEFNGVGGTSSEDLWAVGTASEHPRAENFGIAMHWNGKEWTRVELPGADGVAMLYDVLAVAPDDVWATGIDEGRMVKLHWNGEKWSIEHESDISTDSKLVRQGDALLAFDGKAVQRYDGDQWQTMPAPEGELMDGAVLPGGDIAGVGKVGEGEDQRSAWLYQE